jgi:NADPH-dependent curcumin reductase CurA
MDNLKCVLARRPTGIPSPDTFRLVEEPVRELADGEVLIENQAFAIDPAIRGMLDDRESYLPPVPIGGVIPAMAVGRVVRSRNAAFKEGDYGRGFLGWERYSILNPGNIAMENLRVDPRVPPTVYVGALGWSGLTAYIGLKKIGGLASGETVVMSAAAGAVGSVGCQIATLSGCRVVGIVGSDEKVQTVRRLGADAAINYKTAPDLAAAVRAACPDGVHLYFDNVGGRTLDVMLASMRDYGRIVVCGMIANYNHQDDQYPIRNLWQVLVRRITMRGFLAYEHADVLPEAEEALTHWITSGRLAPLENVTTGLERAPAAFIRLMSGDTTGKTVVRVDDRVACTPGALPGA